MTQISRAIADTGHPARRGQAYVFTSLVPYLTAPAWWLHSVATAYETIKYLQALVMALAIFPAYGIARFVVSRPWALFAGVATIAAPALSYAPILVEEPFAYPVATLALYLIVRAVARPSRRALALAAAGCILAVATRSQLVALAGAFGLCVLALGWRTERMERWRTTWTRYDWVGAGLLGVGLVLAFSAFMGRHSLEWATTTALWKGRIFDYGAWAAGALAIGCGVLPLIATLAVLLRPRADWREPGLRAFGIVTGSAFVSFGWYAAVKGAYLSTILSSLVVERNLIYLYPLLFTGTAVLFARRDARWWAVLPAALVVLYLVTATPTRIDQFPYYEAHGLSILAFFNRELGWASGRIDTALIVAVFVGALAALAVRPLAGRSDRAARGLVVALAVLVLGWNLTTEIYAASGEHDFSTRMAKNMADPPDWVDRTTRRWNRHGTGAADHRSNGHLVDRVLEPVAAELLEHRRLGRRAGADAHSRPGTARRHPDALPGTDYVLAYNGVTLQAPEVEQVRGDDPVPRGPAAAEVAFSQAAVFEDGWTGRDSSYNRYTARADGPGSARIDLSRAALCTTAPDPGRRDRLDRPARDRPDKQPHIGRVTAQRLVRVRPCEDQAQTILLPAPRGPWRVEVTSDTFVPAELDPSKSDRRRLGVQVAFGFQPE